MSLGLIYVKVTRSATVWGSHLRPGGSESHALTTRLVGLKIGKVVLFLRLIGFGWNQKGQDGVRPRDLRLGGPTPQPLGHLTCSNTSRSKDYVGTCRPCAKHKNQTGLNQTATRLPECHFSLNKWVVLFCPKKITKWGSASSD